MTKHSIEISNDEKERFLNNTSVSEKETDSKTSYCAVDLLQHLDNAHLLKRMAIAVAIVCDLPRNTVFLIAMGVVSSIVARKYRVKYQYYDSLPVGLYVVAEQPSGTAKSRCIKFFQKAFFKAEKDFLSDLSARIAHLEERLDADKNDTDASKELKEIKAKKHSPFFTTNTTPESLEEDLNCSNGFFSAVSSEQGLFNTLLGRCYSDNRTSNNDLLLNAFDGGHIHSSRLSRNGYCGEVIGSVTLFAQNGSIDTILNSSNGTGLSERFLFITEKHNLGHRKHKGKKKGIHPDLIAEYDEIAYNLAMSVLQDNSRTDELEQLELSENSFDAIDGYRDDIEPLLADDAKYSHISLRGAAAKIDMQIMKFAAILHAFSDDKNHFRISEKTALSAIKIAGELLESQHSVLEAKGIIGMKAEYVSIMTLFSNDGRPRIESNIINSKVKTEPFKSITGNKSQAVRLSLREMVERGLLNVITDSAGAVYYSPAE